MSIREHLSSSQIDKIVSIIKNQCDQAARKDKTERIKVSEEIYKNLTKARKAHDITADIYLGFFYLENEISGLKAEMIENGSYYQPELRGEGVVIHIYHQSNKLQSKLVKERSAEPDAVFYCIRYNVGKHYRLQSIEAVRCGPNGEREQESLYQAPRIEAVAG